MIRTETTIAGPVFDGQAAAAVDDFLDDASRELAELGVNEVRARLSSVLDDPSGHYRSRIVTDRTTTEWQVTDGGVVYGPWLEGTGSRNKTTRFKGYQTFRRTRQWLEGRVVDVAEDNLGRHLSQMGGE